MTRAAALAAAALVLAGCGAAPLHEADDVRRAFAAEGIRLTDAGERSFVSRAPDGEVQVAVLVFDDPQHAQGSADLLRAAEAGELEEISGEELRDAVLLRSRNVLVVYVEERGPERLAAVRRAVARLSRDG